MSTVRFVVMILVGLLLVLALAKNEPVRYSFFLDSPEADMGGDMEQHAFLGDMRTGEMWMWVPAQGGEWAKVAELPKR